MMKMFKKQRAAQLAACALFAGGLLLGGTGTASAGNSVILHEDGTYEVNGEKSAPPEDIKGGEGNRDNPEGASNNEVQIKGGTCVAVLGGKGGGVTAWYNTVTVSGGTVGGDKYRDVCIEGGFGDYESANYNTVIIRGGTIIANVIGAEARVGSTEGTTNYNEVTIEGGSIKGTVMGGAGGAANSNKVTISGGTIEGEVYAADASTEGKNNSVTISGAPVLAKAAIIGTDSAAVVGNDNKLVLQNTETLLVESVKNFDTISFASAASTGGALTVEGGEVVLPVGWKLITEPVMTLKPADTSTVLSKDDALTLLDATGAKRIEKLDSFAASGESSYAYTLASLENVKDSGVTITGSLSAPSASADGNRILCNAADIDTITYGTVKWETNGTVISLAEGKSYDLSKTTVDTMNIGFTTDSLKTVTAGNNTMTLLDTKGNTTLAASNLKAKQVDYAVGTALKGTGIASLAENGNVMYTITTENNEPALTETDQPHAAVIAASANAVAVSSAAAASVDTAMGVLASAPAGGTTTFSGFGAGTSRVKTGSHVKSTMWQGTFGAGTKKELANGGAVDWGVFFECGRGNYTTYNEQAKYTRGDGKMHYVGGGFTARYTTPSDFYTELGVHAGRMTNDADRILVDNDGNVYGYKSDSNYYGISLGIGKTFKISDARSFDVYGTFYYNNSGDADYDLAGEHYSIDATKSELLRIGARYKQKLNEAAKLYAGAAFDYEFNGKSSGTVKDRLGDKHDIRTSSIKGGSGMLELGVELKAPDSPWELDIGAKAYAGRHQGFSGNIGIKYLF